MHRRSPLRLPLPRHRNPWPWPTTETWTCKQTGIPQRQDEDTDCLQILVWWPFFHLYSKDSKKKATRCIGGGWWEPRNLPPSLKAKFNLTVWLFVSCSCREGDTGSGRRWHSRTKQRRIWHLTLSHQCWIFGNGNVTRLLGKQAFLCGTENK